MDVAALDQPADREASGVHPGTFQAGVQVEDVVAQGG